MSRNYNLYDSLLSDGVLNSTVNNYLLESGITVAYFVDVSYRTTLDYILHLSTLPFDIDVTGLFGTRTYEGAGELLTVSDIEETAQLTATGISVTLSGLNSIASGLALSGLASPNGQQRTLRVYLALFGDVQSDGSLKPFGEPIYGTPILVFDGYQDSHTIRTDGTATTVTISGENKLADFERTNPQRFTMENQLRRGTRTASYSGSTVTVNTDQSLLHVIGMQKKVIKWGA